MIKTGKELADACIDAARNQTLYVKGCIGAPMTAANKKRYTSNLQYNARPVRTAKITAASEDTFGFDCVCFIKALLWGWSGDKSKTYGGAVYVSNGVPDIGESAMLSACTDVSADFSRIQVGEYLWRPGHCGIYIGDGIAVECTPAWADGVQITAVHNIGKKAGYNGRAWAKHGKLPYVTYEEAPAFTVLQWQKAAMADGFAFPKYGPDGLWGAECEAVARKAVCKQRIVYRYKNLTRLVQRAVGVAVDGKFGAKTKAAVISYQQRHSLTPDGEVGIETYKMMLGVK